MPESETNTSTVTPMMSMMTQEINEGGKIACKSRGQFPLRNSHSANNRHFVDPAASCRASVDWSSMVIEDGQGVQLYVKGLSPDATEESLELAFARFGQISQVLIVRDKETQACKGFGFVTFENSEDARDALKAMDRKELNGSSIHVEEATSRRDRTFSRGGRGGRGSYGGPPGRGGGYRGRGGAPRGRGGSYGGGGYDDDRGSRFQSDRGDRFEPERRSRPFESRGDRFESRGGGGRFESSRGGGGRFESSHGGGGRFESSRGGGGSRFESSRGGGGRFESSRGGGGRFESSRGGGSSRFESSRGGGSSRFESSRFESGRFESGGRSERMGGYSGGGGGGYGGGGSYGSPKGGSFRDGGYGSRDGQRDSSREYRERSPIGRDRNSLLSSPRDRDMLSSRRDSRGYGGGSDYRGGPASSRDYNSQNSRDYGGGGGGGRDYGNGNGRDYGMSDSSRDYMGKGEYSSGSRYDDAPPRRDYDSMGPSSRSFSESSRALFDSYGGGGGGYDSAPRGSSRMSMGDSRRDDRMRDGGMRRGPPPSRDFSGPPTKRIRGGGAGGPPRSPPMRRGDSPPPRGLSFSSRGGRGGPRGRGGPPTRRY